MATQNCRADLVYKRAIRVAMVIHAPLLHATLSFDKGESVLELHAAESSTFSMQTFFERLGARVGGTGVTKREIARQAGISEQRLNNYIKGTRTPDLRTLVKLAGALRCTTDWLLGASESVPVDVSLVISRILELDGIPAERAAALASISQEALQLLSALPSESDARGRSLVAAQAAWQLRSSAKPS